MPSMVRAGHDCVSLLPLQPMLAAWHTAHQPIGNRCLLRLQQPWLSSIPSLVVEQELVSDKPSDPSPEELYCAWLQADESIIVRGNGTIFLAGPPLVKAATGGAQHWSIHLQMPFWMVVHASVAIAAGHRSPADSSCR